MPAPPHCRRSTCGRYAVGSIRWPGHDRYPPSPNAPPREAGSKAGRSAPAPSLHFRHPRAARPGSPLAARQTIGQLLGCDHDQPPVGAATGLRRPHRRPKQKTSPGCRAANRDLPDTSRSPRPRCRSASRRPTTRCRRSAARHRRRRSGRRRARSRFRRPCPQRRPCPVPGARQRPSGPMGAAGRRLKMQRDVPHAQVILGHRTDMDAGRRRDVRIGPGLFDGHAGGESGTAWISHRLSCPPSRPVAFSSSNQYCPDLSTTNGWGASAANSKCRPSADTVQGSDVPESCRNVTARSGCVADPLKATRVPRRPADCFRPALASKRCRPADRAWP